MIKRTGICLALVLVGCEPAPAPMTSADTADVLDTVESLAADPVRLKEVQRQCRLNNDDVGDALCSAASEAYRRRFMGGGAQNDVPQTTDSE